MIPDVDYTRTARRPRWPDLPEQVRSAVAGSAGAPVTFAAEPVGSGFTRSYAGVLTLADGREVFAKAAGPRAPYAVEAVRREREVLPALTSLGCVTRLVGGRTVGDWEVLVLEVVVGAMPGQPWTGEDVESVHAACVEAAALPTSVLRSVGARPFVQDIADGSDVATLRGLAAGGPWPVGIRPLEDGAARELADLGGRAPQALDGEHLVHGDLRPDNLLIRDDGTAVLCDWNWLGTGPRWMDWVGLWPLMVHHGADPVDLAGSPLLEAAGRDDADVFLAVLAGYMVRQVAGLTEEELAAPLHAHRRFTAATTLDLLRLRRGWA